MADFTPFHGTGVGQRISNSIGQGIGEGLQNQLQIMAQQKAQALQRKQTARGLQAIPGITPEKAEQLSYLDPQSLQLVLKQQLAQPGNEAYAAALGNLLGTQQESQSGEMAQLQQPLTVPQQAAQKSTLTPQQREQMSEYLKTPQGQKQFTGPKEKH